MAGDGGKGRLVLLGGEDGEDACAAEALVFAGRATAGAGDVELDAGAHAKGGVGIALKKVELMTLAGAVKVEGDLAVGARVAEVERNDVRRIAILKGKVANLATAEDILQLRGVGDFFIFASHILLNVS